MNEKRFREIVSVEVIVDDVTGKRYVGIVDSAFIDLVNELHEENMMLKGEVAHYKLILISLKKEAERLSQIHCLSDKE